jgi:hypothetical protein
MDYWSTNLLVIRILSCGFKFLPYIEIRKRSVSLPVGTEKLDS